MDVDIYDMAINIGFYIYVYTYILLVYLNYFVFVIPYVRYAVAFASFRYGTCGARDTTPPLLGFKLSAEI
jgi:hypothetical protein